MQFKAFSPKSRSRSPVDRAIHSASSEQGAIRGIDNGIHTMNFCYITLNTSYHQYILL
jgi:hypothetical protein